MNKKIALLSFLMVFLFKNSYSAGIFKSTDELAIENSTCEIKPFDTSENEQKKATLRLQMTIKKHTSGAAYAVALDLLNNTDKTLYIKMISDINQNWLPSLMLKHGIDLDLAKARKRYAIDDPTVEINYDESFIKSGEKMSWLINIKDMVRPADEVKELIVNNNEGRLMMDPSIWYFVDDDHCDKSNKFASMTVAEDLYFSLESYSLPNELMRQPNSP